MKAVHKVRNGQTMQPAIAVGLGVGVSVILAVISAVCAAIMIQNETIKQENMRLISVCTQVMSAFLGSLAASKLAGKMPAIFSAITCIVYFLLLLAANILFMDGQFSGVGEGLLCIIAGGVLSILPIFIKKKERKHKRPRIG